jgi:transposase-like protein
MAPRKLSDADRQDILNRYRQPEETTVTIASHYGVSTSTISRILKQNFSEDEYDALIQQKRSGGYKSSGEQRELSVETPEAPEPEPVAEPFPVPKPSPRLRNRTQPSLPEPAAPTPSTSDRPTSRRRRSGSQSDQLELPSIRSQRADVDEQAQYEEDEASASELPVLTAKELKEIEAELGKVKPPEVEEELDDEDLEDDELEDDLDDEDLEDDDLEGDFDDEDFDDEVDSAHPDHFATVQIHRGAFVQVLPLSEAEMPRTCYVVVDRSAELITRPLKDFADLGQIPEEEILAKTLPIFDNHRVAKRFTRRMQRVVKVPDSRVLQKVGPYLQAKGITRVLIDGNVYSL